MAGAGRKWPLEQPLANLKTRIARLEEARQEMGEEHDVIARVIEVLPGGAIVALYKRLMNGPADQGCMDIICKTPAAVELVYKRRGE